jgi:hypothetical protein
MGLSACLRAGSSLLYCDRLARGKYCPESRICFKVETVTRTERSSLRKDRNFFICRLTPSFVLEPVFHSSIVTDLPMEKTVPKVASGFKVETVTRTERSSPGKDRNFFVCRSHQRSDSPIAEKSIHWLLLKSTSNGVVRFP